MATQRIGGQYELETCGYCRRGPYKGRVEHKPGCPCESGELHGNPNKIRLFERGYRQSYHFSGLCFNTDPSYKLGWETGNHDDEMDRLREEAFQAQYGPDDLEDLD